MNTRRLVAFLLGVWIAGSISMAIVATQNFRNVDRLLKDPSPKAERVILTLGHDTARKFLRYHSAELNRRFFGTWEKAQLALGAVVFLLMLFTTTVGWPPLASNVLAVGLVAVQHWVLTARIIWYGRAIDFLDAGVLSPERQKFDTLHQSYAGMELLKLVLLLGLTARFLWGHGRRRRRVEEDIDTVDDADHRHVNR